TSRLRKLRRQGPSPTPWGTKLCPFVPRSFVPRSFVPRSEARGEGTRRQAGRGRPAGPGKPVSHRLPPTSRPRKLRRQGPSPTPWGTKLCPFVPRSFDPRSFVPRSEARGEGTRRQAGRGRPAGPGKPVSHRLPPTSRLRKLRRQGPSPTPWGTKLCPFVPRSFVPRSEARGEGTRRQAGRGRPAGPGRARLRTSPYPPTPSDSEPRSQNPPPTTASAASLASTPNLSTSCRLLLDSARSS